MTRVHSDILQSVDKDRAAILVLLDLSAAFDTLDHALLLQTLALDIDRTQDRFDIICGPGHSGKRSRCPLRYYANA